MTQDYKRVVLVDFDWCEKYGVARYPAIGLNKSLSFPNDAEANGLIEKAHDAHWFRVVSNEAL